MTNIKKIITMPSDNWKHFLKTAPRLLKMRCLYVSARTDISCLAQRGGGGARGMPVMLRTEQSGSLRVQPHRVLFL
jgi:hypothetical protein